MAHHDTLLRVCDSNGKNYTAVLLEYGNNDNVPTQAIFQFPKNKSLAIYSTEAYVAILKRGNRELFREVEFNCGDGVATGFKERVEKKLKANGIKDFSLDVGLISAMMQARPVWHYVTVAEAVQTEAAYIASLNGK